MVHDSSCEQRTSSRRRSACRALLRHDQRHHVSSSRFWRTDERLSPRRSSRTTNPWCRGRWQRTRAAIRGTRGIVIVIRSGPVGQDDSWGSPRVFTALPVGGVRRNGWRRWPVWRNGRRTGLKIPGPLKAVRVRVPPPVPTQAPDFALPPVSKSPSQGHPRCSCRRTARSAGSPSGVALRWRSHSMSAGGGLWMPGGEYDEGVRRHAPHPSEGCAVYRKFAVTFMSRVMVILVGLAVPLASPLQPSQGEPAAGVAVSVTTVRGA